MLNIQSTVRCIQISETLKYKKCASLNQGIYFIVIMAISLQRIFNAILKIQI